jgi:opacity protein-like surface antigen
MRCKRTVAVVAFAALLLAPLAAAADNEKGRVIEPGARWRLTFNVGDKSPIDGSVQETERPFDAVRTEGTPQAPESFTFDELGLSESESTYGLSLEYRWKWVTLFVDSTFMEATATGAAPRDFFIGVKNIEFEGRDYEYQKIPEGGAYTGDIDLLALNTRVAFTPVTVNAGGNAEFVPWIFLGIFTLAGQVDFDAGPATALELYENPPREYVVGGQSDGDAAAFAPEIGLGGEVTWKTGERSRLSLQGNVGIFEFTGSTGDLGISSRNEKDIDLDYTAYDARLYWDFPMTTRTNFLVGLRYAYVDVGGSATAKDATDEEIAARREKFNKDVDFHIDTLVLSFGLRW